MNTLLNYLDYLVRMCETTEQHNKRSMYDQAYGAIMYHCRLYPDNVTYQKVEALWNEVYRPQFEKLVYGV